MGAEQRKQVLAGGAAAAKLVEAVKQDSVRRAPAAAGQPGEGQPGIAAEEAGVVTSEETAGMVAGKEPAGVEPRKSIGRNDLEMETDALRELISDVTPDVTPEGASHDFAAVD